MSMKMEEEVKRWTAKRKSALVLEIIQGETTAAEASRASDLSPSEIENLVDDAKRVPDFLFNSMHDVVTCQPHGSWLMASTK